MFSSNSSSSRFSFAGVSSSPDSVFPSPKSAADKNLRPSFFDSDCDNNAGMSFNSSAVEADSPTSQFFPFQCKGLFKRQDAVVDHASNASSATSSPKIEELLLRASQMKIRGSPAQGVLKNIANALSPHDKTPKRRLSLASASSSSACSTPTPKRNCEVSPSLGIAPLCSDASPSLPSQNSPTNGYSSEQKGYSKGVRGFTGRRHLFPRSTSLPAWSMDKENSASRPATSSMSPIKVEIPAASPPPFAFSPEGDMEFCGVSAAVGNIIAVESHTMASSVHDDDSRQSTASNDSGQGSLDFTAFCASRNFQRHQRRGRNSSGAASSSTSSSGCVMSPDSIAIDEDALMSPPLSETDSGVSHHSSSSSASSTFRRKQFSGNSDDGFMEELENMSPMKESPTKMIPSSSGIFSLLNAPLIKRNLSMAVDDDDEDAFPLVDDDEDEENKENFSFTQIRERKNSSSPVRQLRADSCPCPFSPVIEEATPLFNLDVNSQPSPFSSADTTLGSSSSHQAASQNRSCLLTRFSHSFKRPEPPRHDEPSTPLQSCKRRKSVASPFDLRKPSAALSQRSSAAPSGGKNAHKLTVRSYSISDDRLERALSNSTLAAEQGVEELADCSGRTYVLPTIRGDHSDLKAISPQTMTDLMEGKYDDKVEGFHVVDCRYPYEYKGGHIENGRNLYTEEMILESFFESMQNSSSDPEKRTIIIFHCEFSKERGPRLMRFLRKQDRKNNAEAYPYLQYPEIYLLDGGYKNFYVSTMKTHCVPRSYVPMFEKQYASELRFFRRKTKSWAGNDPRASVGLQRTRTGTGLKF